MIITKITCDNMYMFENFLLDLTYNRKLKHCLTNADTLFPGSKIRVRKNIIIMGGNASGKTTFGKMLCFILNYIFRGQIDNNYFNLYDIPYKKNADSHFSLEFVLNDTAYLLNVSFNGSLLIKETLRACKIYRSYNVDKMRDNLQSSKIISSFDSSTVKSIPIAADTLVSNAFLVNMSPEIKQIKSEMHYLFSISKRTNKTIEQHTDIQALNDILPKIDNTVCAVKNMYVDNKATNTYQIVFRNGETLVVPNGDIASCKDRLSHGTFEAIEFLKLFAYMKKYASSLIYADEILAHMHSELEAYLIRKAILVKPAQSQFFITTHNIDIFQLNVPANVFLFFRRNENGYNEVIYPSELLNKNDRNLTQYYINDYFGVMPDYSVLDQPFEDYFFTAKESNNE